MLPFRFPAEPHQTPTSFLFRFLKVSYLNSVPASSLSEPHQTHASKRHIPQRNFAPKTAHSQGCSSHFNFRVGNAACIAAGLWCIERFIFLPIILLPDSHRTPIIFQCGAYPASRIQCRCPPDSHHIPNHLPFHISHCNLIQFGASQFLIGTPPDSYPQKPYSAMQFRF